MMIVREFKHLAKEVPMDTVSIPVKAKPEDPKCLEEKTTELSIVPPHLLTYWLLGNGLVKFDQTRARKYWEHHRSMKAPWMTGTEAEHPELSEHFQPVALYADEAEYTASKEKITVLFLRS